MRLLKQAMAVLGIVTMIVVLVAVVAPKATHSMVAALVEVSNTATAPATTEDISHSASQILNIFCYSAPFSTAAACYTIAPNGTTSLFTSVPTGYNFIITSIEFNPTSPKSGTSLVVDALCGYAVTGFSVSSDTSTVLAFPTSGIPVGPGCPVSDVVYSGQTMQVTYHGYLSSN